MANKNDNYYFINGNELESTTLCFPYKGSYYKNVRDISDIDIATMDLGTDLRNALKEANPTIKLNTHNYVGKYPYTQGIKIYKPIEIFKESESTSKIIGKFRELTEERNYNYYNDNPLELTDSDKVLSLVDLIISSFNANQKQIVFSKKSIIGKIIKMNHKDNKYLFQRQISNYTQVRNLVICYLYIKSGRYIPPNYIIKRMSESLENIKRLYPEDPKVIKDALDVYKAELLTIKQEEEKRKIEEEYNKKVQEDYHQMTLFDIYPCEETAQICRNIKTRK